MNILQIQSNRLNNQILKIQDLEIQIDYLDIFEKDFNEEGESAEGLKIKLQNANKIADRLRSEFNTSLESY